VNISTSRRIEAGTYTGKHLRHTCTWENRQVGGVRQEGPYKQTQGKQTHTSRSRHISTRVCSRRIGGCGPGHKRQYISQDRSIREIKRQTQRYAQANTKHRRSKHRQTHSWIYDDKEGIRGDTIESSGKDSAPAHKQARHTCRGKQQENEDIRRKRTNKKNRRTNERSQGTTQKHIDERTRQTHTNRTSKRERGNRKITGKA